MAVRRRPLSARVISTLRAKAKNRKNITLGMLKKVYRRGQGAFLSSGSRPRTSMASWSMGRVNSFLRGSRKHDTDLRRKRKKQMKTNKEKFVEIDGRIKLVNQKIDLIIKNHLHHMKKDIDRILYSLGAIGLLVLGQLLYLLTKQLYRSVYDL